MVSAFQLWTVSLCIQCYYHVAYLAAAMHQQYQRTYVFQLHNLSQFRHPSILQVEKILKMSTSQWTSQLGRMSSSPFLFAPRKMTLLSSWRTSFFILRSDMKLSTMVLPICKMAQSRFSLKIMTVSVVPIHNSSPSTLQTTPISIDLSVNTWSACNTGIYCT